MADPRIGKLADIILDYSLGIKAQEWVMIQADIGGLPLVVALTERLAARGAYTSVNFRSDDIQEAILKYGSDDVIGWQAPDQKLQYDQTDAMIAIRAPMNTRALTQIAPQKIQLFNSARRPLQERYMQRTADGEFRWNLTQFPTAAYAQEADMSLSEYEDFLYQATFASLSDPIKEWRRVQSEQDRLIKWLKGKKHVQLKGANIDLSLSIEGRTFVNACGTANLPDGEIFTGPVEESVNGWVRFSYPSIRYGTSVEGVEFQFENGKIVHATAEKNEDFLHSMLNSDAGSRYLGEFAVGTNYQIQQFTKSILFDEKIGGTVHMAVGAGYPETGSHNKSSIHWDFICDMRTDSAIFVDGDLFYENGRFVI